MRQLYFLILLFTLSINVFASSSRNVIADTIQSTDKTKTWNLPSLSGTLSTFNPVAINTSLLPDTDNSINLGSSTKRFNTTYSGSINLKGAMSGDVYIYARPNGGSAVNFVLPGQNGSSGQVLKTDGSGLTYWEDGGSSSSATFAIIREEKASGTAGGSSVANTWTVRPLSTEYFDESNIVTLSNNQITLGAGKYLIMAESVFSCSTGMSRLRLNNITDSTIDMIGFTHRCVTAVSSFLKGIITITGTKTFQLEYYNSIATTTTGLGQASSVPNTPEIYANVTIQKL